MGIILSKSPLGSEQRPRVQAPAKNGVSALFLELWRKGPANLLRDFKIVSKRGGLLIYDDGFARGQSVWVSPSMSANGAVKRFFLLTIGQYGCV